MKLLFDEHASARLAAALSDEYPASVQVRDIGLARATDAAIWVYAQDHGFTILSKDSDFHRENPLGAAPPKVIRIQRGNCCVAAFEVRSGSNPGEIVAFGADAETASPAFSWPVAVCAGYAC